MSITVTHELDSHVIVRDGDVELARYTYLPTVAAGVAQALPASAAHPRSARPGHPVPPARSRLAQGHRLVAARRNDENFWGGPTYVHGQFYVQLENNGVQHQRDGIDIETAMPRPSGTTCGG